MRCPSLVYIFICKIIILHLTYCSMSHKGWNDRGRKVLEVSHGACIDGVMDGFSKVLERIYDRTVLNT